MTIRVLLADDHGLLREGLRALLAATGDIAVVGEAGTGAEAVQLAQASGAGIVLMDISMPDLNGVEATALIRRKCPDARVIILSMHLTSEHVYRALAAGADGYVLKESVAAEVVAAVRRVHAGRKYFSPSVAGMALELRANPRAASPLASLSPRERHVLQQVAEGRSSAEIAVRLHLSPRTVETYRHRLMRKLDLKDVPALVRFALAHGIVPLT